ncbi:hypothetical protein Agabi119p4_7678 [Agaricus bisporus var. burnettii]|uniref:Uncharacterized protein n=1 Tax=Agaricus bisporus var. burnettii TaxID=192524 RepID=A0A8H7C8P1_AGABI|nr:hypothetical protein Agabi119p4_7678 [Agaricus bisporus var. burnettii]
MGKKGSVQLNPGEAAQPHHAWNETHGPKAVNQQPLWSTLFWKQCKHVISHHENTCKTGSWVFASSPFGANQIITGRIIEIICQESNQSLNIVLIDLFEILSERHPIFGMPMLSQPFGEQRTAAVHGQDILFDYNVQHDCPAVGCIGTEDNGAISHAPLERHVINAHAFHNAHLLREVIPR